MYPPACFSALNLRSLSLIRPKRFTMCNIPNTNTFHNLKYSKSHSTTVPTYKIEELFIFKNDKSCGHLWSYWKVVHVLPCSECKIFIFHMTNQMRRNSFATLYRQSYTENLIGRLRKFRIMLTATQATPSGQR